MGSAGDATENLILDAMFGDDAAANMASTHYLALFTATPGDAGGGTEVGTSGTGYARVTISNDDTNWDPATSGQKLNAAAFQFPLALDDWGTVTSWALMTTSTPGTGNVVVWGALNSPTAVNTGSVAYFPIGSVSIFAD